MTISITALRRNHGDQAIVDLLQLQQLGLVPGVVSRGELEALWGVTQPNVCRRMQAVHALGICTIRTTHRAGYTICDQPPAPVKAKPRPMDPTTARMRWEAARQQWRQGVAA